jgi:uncharacterized damage-inducible protein DinB
MNGVEAIRTALNSTQKLTTWFLSDLSDADLLVRPAPGANHIAWQLGHVIVSERSFARDHFPGLTLPELPAGFEKQHGKETQFVDPPAGFAAKAVYLDLFAKVRRATLAGLETLNDAALDQPTTGSMSTFAPTLGALLLLMANHEMMHSGQFSVVRRKLGKPVLF